MNLYGHVIKTCEVQRASQKFLSHANQVSFHTLETTRVTSYTDRILVHVTKSYPKHMKVKLNFEEYFMSYWSNAYKIIKTIFY